MSRASGRDGDVARATREPRPPQRPKTAALLAALMAWPLAAQAGPRELWGAPEDPPLSRYRALCDEARGLIDNARGTSPEALRGTAQKLRQATALYPEGAEGWALLGRALLESGDAEGARPALEAALRRGAGDSRLVMGLGLLKAQSGDLPGALELYLRLQGRGMTTPLLLRRTGDVQMALGRLGEAAESYRRACTASGSSQAERARACLGLAVAHDRDGRLQASAAALRRALQLDGGGDVLTATDFVPAADRAYYQALWAEGRRQPPCEQVQPLRLYLTAQRAPAPANGYGDRAQARLDRLEDRLGNACKAEYSPRPGTTDEPLGSQRDRDGGVPWQARAEDATK